VSYSIPSLNTAYVYVCDYKYNHTAVRKVLFSHLHNILFLKFNPNSVCSKDRKPIPFSNIYPVLFSVLCNNWVIISSYIKNSYFSSSYTLIKCTVNKSNNKLFYILDELYSLALTHKNLTICRPISILCTFDATRRNNENNNPFVLSC
jgi:hypothetical protein